MAAGCSAYHSNVHEESTSRTAGCSAYPTKDSHRVEQSYEAVQANFDEELHPKGRYGVISLFDGVSSVVPLLKKKIGYAPVVVILADFFCLMAAWLNEVVVRAVALLSALTKEFTMHIIL